MSESLLEAVAPGTSQPHIDQKLLTKHVLVDTNIHVAAKFHYRSRAFRRLRDLAAAHMAVVVSTTVDSAEVRANIQSHARDAALKLQQFQRELAALSESDDARIRVLVEKVDEAAIAEELLKGFSTYSEECQIEVIPVAIADTEGVFRDYFSNAAPFGSGKKRSEFPDAFIIATLVAWCRSNHEEMYVVSQDQGMREAAKATGCLHPLERLEEFLDLLVRAEHHDAAVRALRWLPVHRDDVVKRVTADFEYGGFDVDELDGDVGNPEVEEVRMSTPLLQDVQQERLVFSIPAQITFTADISYDDPNSGIWDSEEKALFFVEQRHVRVRATHEIEIELTLREQSSERISASEGVEPSLEIESLLIDGKNVSESVVLISPDSEVVDVYEEPEEHQYDWQEPED